MTKTLSEYGGFRCCCLMIGFSFLMLASLFLFRNTYCVYRQLEYEIMIQEKRAEEISQKDVFTRVVVPNISNPFYFLNESSLYCLEASVVNVFDGLFNIGLVIGAIAQMPVFVRLWLAGEAVLFAISALNVLYLVANGETTYETCYVIIILYVNCYLVVYKYLRYLKAELVQGRNIKYTGTKGYQNYY